MSQYMTLIEAKKLAAEHHRGQTDHINVPYIQHVMRVAVNVQLLWPDAPDYVLVAAWLHDIVEDCDVSLQDLLDWGVDPRAVRIIELLTKPDDDERSYDEVISDLIASGNLEAMLVKLCDNLDNSDPVRNQILHQTDPEKAEWFKQKYTASIGALCDVLKLDAAEVMRKVYGYRQALKLGKTDEQARANMPRFVLN